MNAPHQPLELAQQRVARRGVTLVELLVVILLVLILSALALQTLAPALKGRRVREGARQLEVFINRARNRAMLTGRPSGFQVERSQEFPEASSVVSLIEVPEAYTGDYDNSGAECYVVGHGGPLNAPPGPTHGILLVRPCLITHPQDVANRDLDVWASPDPTFQTLIREGDQIQFEGSSYKYTMYSVIRSKYYQRSKTNLTLPDLGNLPMWYLMENEYVQPEEYELNGFRKMTQGLGPVSLRSSPTTAGFARRYKIFMQPVKAMGGGMTLPDQVVIDLNYSGVGGAAAPFHARKGDAANSKYGAPFCGDANIPDDTEPITVMFHPDGTVATIKSRATSVDTSNSNNSVSYSLSTVETRVSAPIYFLVGKRVRVPINPEYSVAAQLQNNWTDTECLWVAINPTSGLIMSAENMQVLPDMIPYGLNRGTGGSVKDTTNMQDGNVAVIQGYDAFDHVVYGARRAVIARLAIGGR